MKHVKVQARVRYSNSKKSKITEYNIITPLGSRIFEVFETGIFKGCISEKNYSPLNFDEVPYSVLRDFRSSPIYMNDDNIEELRLRHVESQARRDRLAAKEAQHKAVLAQRSHVAELASQVKLSDISFDDIFDHLENYINSQTEYPSKKREIFWYKGIKFNYTYGGNDYDWIYRFIKLSHAGSGFSFRFNGHPIDIDLAKDKDRMRFVWQVCVAGEHIPNKGIVEAFAKKSSKPSFETLRKEGFDISRKYYDSIDVHSVESIIELFAKI